ncbi:hypothetical protein [Streptomyces cucumeris]|uniref:hypothetical protein n=1 Tax=Streptomyces cucumeris TaxID=2962890 RepID=UPI0020C8C305|nr:hypothetical protein [Streptomyces sp. NEAU-Y11]MCP9213193.1 hypothetical protein [Streptomyces sp. NEAU-Y11]
MTRMKKYLVAACAVTVMGGVPTAAFALTSSASTATDAVKAGASSMNKGSVKVVAPGEKITVAPGVKMWLTQNGKQCLQHSFETTPWCQTLAGAKPGANLAGLDSNDHRGWLSGGYIGNGVPDHAQIRTLSGTTHATVVTLAGNPGWGAWYAQARTTSPAPADNKHPKAFLRNVTVYDTAGKTIVSTDTPLAADGAQDVSDRKVISEPVTPAS